MTTSATGPTAIIGGAQKSATTSLFRLLDEHPDVSTPANKEPQFFAFADGPTTWSGPGAQSFERTVVSTEAEYRGLFARGVDHQHRVEASTLYMSEPGAPERMMAFDSTLKVIFILRDPADRAHSAWSYFRLRGLEELDSVINGVGAEAERRAAGWPPQYGYLRLSQYGDHLRRWLGVVPERQILCLGQRQMATDPMETMRRVEAFLDLRAYDGYSTGVRHNVSGQPRSAWLHRAIDLPVPYRAQLRKVAPRPLRNAVAAARNRNLGSGDGLTQRDRAQLVELLAPQIEMVRDLIGPELTVGWDSV